MKCKASKLKKHNFCNTDRSEAVTSCSTKTSALRRSLSAINLQVFRSATLPKTDAKTLTFTFYPRCFISVCFTNSMGPVNCNFWYFTAV